MKYRFLRFPQGKAKALTLSYDDGCQADKMLIEIINKYGIKTTLNICSSWIDDDKAKAIKELADSGGHEIAIHTDNHVAPGNSSAINGINEVLKGREKLEKYFGGIIRGMAYPDTGITCLTSGVSLVDIKQYLSYIGIVYARTLGGDNNNFTLPQDFLEWMPTAHHNNPKLLKYLDDFLKFDVNGQYCSRRSPLLFYLWGHSFEFERNSNWNILEKFCEKVSEKDDVWFATNIEICDYVNAYRSLSFSVDNKTVFNPTVIDVWFDVDGKLICVRSGETLVIE